MKVKMSWEIKYTFLKFLRRELHIFLTSALLLAPITLTLSANLLHTFGRVYSFKHIFWLSLLVFFLAIGFVWYLLKQLVAWSKTTSLRLKRGDYIILIIGLMPVLAAVYTILSQYVEMPFLHSVRTNFQVEIVRSEENVNEDICILGLRDEKGDKIQRKNISQYTVSGDWIADEQGCLFFSSGQTPAGSVAFDYIGKAGDSFQILVLKRQQAESIVVRINQEPAAKLEGLSKQNFVIVRAVLQYNKTHILVWNIARAVAWVALSLLFFTLLILTLKKIRKIGLAFSFLNNIFKSVEKHPWLEFAFILIIVIFMFWPRGTVASNGTPASTDMAYYLSLAKNLYNGNGYVNPDLSPAIYRGPVFPVLIVLSYLLLGESFFSAIILERTFWALTIFIIYVLGNKLFLPRAGFYAAVLALSAVVINRAFYFVWTDGPLLFFILLAQFMFWQAYKDKLGYKWYILMGVIVGIAYLLKQTAVLIAPLPFILWLFSSEYRTKQALKKLCVYAIVSALFIGCWIGYIYLEGGTLNQALGDFQRAWSLISRFGNLFSVQKPSIQLMSSAKSVYSISLPQIIATFYYRDIAQLFAIAILFPLALLFSAYQALRRKSVAHGYLIAGTLLYGYLIPTQVIANLGFRTNLYFYVAGILLIAAMVIQVSNKIANKFIAETLAFFIICSLVIIQIFGRTYNLRNIAPIQNRQTMDYYNAQFQPLANWINKNVPSDEAILIAEREGNILHILTNGNRQFEIISTCRGEYNFWPAIPCLKPYISFWIFQGITDPDTPRDILEGISEPVFLEKITEKGAKHVIVTKGVYPLYYYLTLHPAFEEVTIVDNSAIFRVVSSPQSISTYPNLHWDTCIGDGTAEYFINLKQNDPARYDSRLQNEIKPWMGLSENDLDAFMNWEGCRFGPFPGEYRLP
jgi:4-amino-4-deoxy-L-arabinose transferase-like glycosyltransferase